LSILISEQTRVVVQGITGNQGRFDTELSLAYGVKIVAGVTPGRGGDAVHGVPVFDTVRQAVSATEANAAVLYVPAGGVRDAVIESVEAGCNVILATTENLPRHDAVMAAAVARKHDAWLIGFNTNGIISPGKCKLGGIGGDTPEAIYRPGRIGVVSRSGGMSAEISWVLTRAGRGVSTAVSMGGDRTSGRSMCEYLQLFEADPETDAMIVYGEPGTDNEAEVARAIRSCTIRKPVLAMIAGAFQEAYSSGVSFGHVAAMIMGESDTATSKRRLLAESGAHVIASLDEIPAVLDRLAA
jgi:succinyl-CoA synthetase alpha subunit